MGTTAMPTPVQRPTSKFYWIRKKVPQRIRPLVGKSEVWKSLETTDKRKAVAKCAAVSAELEAEWERLAAGDHLERAVPLVEAPSLTHQDLHALRGVVHVRTRDAYKANPPIGFAAARLVAFGEDDLIDEARRILDADGASYTEADVERFAPLILRARSAAVSDLRRAAGGDYSDHPDLKKIPKRTTPALDLHAAFEEYAAKGGIKGGARGRTAKRWRPKIKMFTDFLGHRDLARMTPDDAYRWVDHLIEDAEKNRKRLARSSIKNVWIASLSAVASFMVERRKLKTVNPFYGVRVRDETGAAVIDAAGPPRKKGFTQDEAAAILTATLLTSSHLTSIETKAARRWLPWLCAYSGARVNELTSLYPSDITQDVVTGIWCMNIKPSMEKTAVWREVPIHSHVIEQGFLEFVDSRRKSGRPLFYDPARGKGGGPGNPQFAKVAERLAEWLHGKKLIPAGVLPNHGWRHTFKSMAKKLKMDPEVEGYITGHRPKDSGSGFDYGDRWVETMSSEIERYPRFDIPALHLPPAPYVKTRRTGEQIGADNAAKAARKIARAMRAS